MNNKDLADLLGISAQIVGRHVKRGMPTVSLEAALEWRKKNLNPFTTKQGRLGGNNGVSRDTHIKDERDSDPVRDLVTYTLTRIIPQLWFSHPGLLSVALGSVGITVSGGKALEAQQLLFCMYTNRIDEFLKVDALYESPECLWLNPESNEGKNLITALNESNTDDDLKDIFTNTETY